MADSAARDGRDGGSASIWMLLAITIVVVAAGIAGAVGSAILAQQRASVAADQAALAGASLVMDGPAAQCAVASRIAWLDGATLQRCQASGADLTVTVSRSLPKPLARFGRALVAARAGP